MNGMEALRLVMILFAALELIRIGLLSWPDIEDRLVRFGIQRLGSVRFDLIAVTGSVWRIYTCIVAVQVASPLWMELAVYAVAVLWTLKYLIGNILLWYVYAGTKPNRYFTIAMATFGTFVARDRDKPVSRMLRAVPGVLPSFLYLLYVPL